MGLETDALERRGLLVGRPSPHPLQSPGAVELGAIQHITGEALECVGLHIDSLEASCGRVSRSPRELAQTTARSQPVRASATPRDPIGNARVGMVSSWPARPLPELPHEQP